MNLIRLLNCFIETGPNKSEPFFTTKGTKITK